MTLCDNEDQVPLRELADKIMMPWVLFKVEPGLSLEIILKEG
jgi:hypothetical protein